jgi:soluble lytic murein transglycosylase-like protein
VRLLEEFVRLQLADGKKLNAAALSLGLLTAPFALNKEPSTGAKTAVTAAKKTATKKPIEKKAEKPEAPKRAKLKTTAASSVSSTSTKTWSRQELLKMVEVEAERVGIDPAFVDAIIRTESNYNPLATSHMGAQGIMQFMPATAADEGLDDPYDPSKAIPAGVRHLKKLLDRFDGDYELAAAAYNSGAKNVDRYGGIPPFKETQGYVPAVMKRMEGSPFAKATQELDF